jgi:predicted nucleic acid-binding protein
MTILDTNVISELMHPGPNPKVVAWLDQQQRSSIWITSITIFEVTYGLETMTSGRKQYGLRSEFESLLRKLEERIAQFDEPAARKAADLMALREKKGRPQDLRDTMIAGIVLARQASLATRNVSHFADISATVVNPWTA